LHDSLKALRAELMPRPAATSARSMELRQITRDSSTRILSDALLLLQQSWGTTADIIALSETANRA